jgi:NitT/TauT family transport system substrate-binding protein
MEARPPHDVTLIETANSAILPAVKSKQAQIGSATEPFITQGIRNGTWGEPFFNVPKELGPYAYSTFNVRLDSIQKDARSGDRLRPRHDEVAEVRLRKPR